MKNTLRVLASNFVGIFAPPIDIVQNLLGLVILRRLYSKKLTNINRFKTREELWSFAGSRLNADNSKLLYLEFGVHEGYSIKYFSEMMENPNSKLVGFDSFEGLPETWRNFINVYLKTL